MTQAIEAGRLEHIRLTPPGVNEGGHYDSSEKAVYVSMDTFTRPDLQDYRDRVDVITSTLGHETGHALNAAESRKTLYFVAAQITEEIRAAGPGGSADVTPLFSLYQRTARRDEAIAEIEGWNALASRIQYTNDGEISREEMLRRAIPTTGCVSRDKAYVPQLARGIVLDQDMHMSDTRLPKAGAINVEPVAQCHFDQSARTLGAQGKADYRNYYGAYLIEQVGQDTAHWVRPPTIKLDMARLGLDPTQLESTGLNLGGRNLGLIDTSDGQQPLTLRHADDGQKQIPDSIVTVHDRDMQDDERIPRLARFGNDTLLQRGEPAPIPATPAAPRDPGHPQHALYETMKRYLPDYTSEARLSQFTEACHTAGITSRSLATIDVEGTQARFSTREGWPRIELDLDQAPVARDTGLLRGDMPARSLPERGAPAQAAPPPQLQGPAH
ncbi:hypothetical protein [Pseudoxanthomonas sp.]|uniref:hypothetical protein n=1 Tax=Pseudoxanthomonas sp. TaxID=1871049 RepID=UPI002FE39A53